jgi:hypothetical protein
MRCFIVHIWLRLDSNRALHEYFSTTDLPYNRKVMKACGISELSPPSRRTFDRRLKTISVVIKERITAMGHRFISEDVVDPLITAMGHRFISEDVVDPLITAIDSTLRLKVLQYGINHL